MNRQPQGIPAGGQFAATNHAEASSVSLQGTEPEELERMSNDAAKAVYEHMGDVDASNDGAGMYLLIATRNGEELHSGCPTLANNDPDSKWYVESSDGSFFKAHPDFGYDADPAAVASWIRETKAQYEDSL